MRPANVLLRLIEEDEEEEEEMNDRHRKRQ